MVHVRGRGKAKVAKARLKPVHEEKSKKGAKEIAQGFKVHRPNNAIVSPISDGQIMMVLDTVDNVEFVFLLNERVARRLQLFLNMGICWMNEIGATGLKRPRGIVGPSTALAKYSEKRFAELDILVKRARSTAGRKKSLRRVGQA
jgi:hypothetical protein